MDKGRDGVRKGEREGTLPHLRLSSGYAADITV